MAVLSALLGCATAFAQSSAPQTNAPTISKVDPPNWWANLPAPMLLVKGENLEGAHFSLSSKTLAIAKTKISENGHWAELWLASDPQEPEQVTITAETAKGKTTRPFVFEKRRAANDGFAGFSSRDVMYLIMTDRFADGDHNNDGPQAKSAEESAEAEAERTRPRGWHGGDLRGIIDHLDYLQALGITTVWITPVYQNHEPDSYHGYGATDMYAVDEHYGTLEDYRALAAALHKRRMKFVLDTVPNHVGPAIDWVSDPPEPD
ncbi:alpha-amylase family glycosyl hydrolase, partial [Silvibacterium sp.]|uniref:alpha-amylase family glycosyl hydrolase n=1 Tax=Silvibacterium sp. TaxID=1964179 RepID=UPI0039E3CAEB